MRHSELGGVEASNRTCTASFEQLSEECQKSGLFVADHSEPTAIAPLLPSFQVYVSPPSVNDTGLDDQTL